MLKTKQRSRKQIKDLQTDLEVINPIESKTILGGDWYNDDMWGGWLDEVVIGGGSSGGGGWYDPWGGYGDPWGDTQGGYGWDYGGGGSGSYTGPGNLPSTVEQQLGSMGACVSYAMAFMSTVLGHSITGANMALHNAQALNLSIMTTITTGLTPAQATQAIQSYFNTTALTSNAQIITALDSGHGVLANYNGHEVAIVNHSGTNYTVADSNTGTYHDISQSQIDLGNGVYEIISVKP